MERLVITWKHRLADRGRLWLAAVLPARCLLCEQQDLAGGWLCANCVQACRANPRPCPCCGLPDSNATCPGCQRQPPPFSTTWAPLRYDGPVRELLHHWKFERQPWLTRTLVDLAMDHACGPPTTPDRIVAMPTHWRRRWSRGFDHSWLLANALAQRVSPRTPVLSALTTPGSRPRQHQLGARERRQNRLGAFWVMDASSQAAIAGRHIALIDDVMTTAATAQAAATALLTAGALRVDVWVIARADSPRARRGQASTTPSAV